MKVSHVHPFSHLYVFFFARCHNQVHHAKTKSSFLLLYCFDCLEFLDLVPIMMGENPNSA
ncbi:hypothetical protein HanHA300_Chr05g0163751 [Helianthus annuus]|nr:hypothetical protein HanHA300_Chr05g0163751 [Helianthus annuus]KAJ0583540.1 hypothetical protein HanHA89_Chr05g0177781 [Helianthus annuus]